MTVQTGLCWTWSETQIACFLLHNMPAVYEENMLPSDLLQPCNTSHSLGKKNMPMQYEPPHGKTNNVVSEQV